MDLSLFPKNEDWGTGDEALDVRLNHGLKQAVGNLSLESIAAFVSFAHSLKTRAWNPSFSLTIDLVAKALLYQLRPDECNDILFKKMRGHIWEKKRKEFSHPALLALKDELIDQRKGRYAGEIDFSLVTQTTSGRNPFVAAEIRYSESELMAKIVYKELRLFLQGGAGKESYTDPFLLALRGGKTLLAIADFAEIWFHEDQLFCIKSFT